MAWFKRLKADARRQPPNIDPIAPTRRLDAGVDRVVAGRVPRVPVRRQSGEDPTPPASLEIIHLTVALSISGYQCSSNTWNLSGPML